MNRYKCSFSFFLSAIIFCVFSSSALAEGPIDPTKQITLQISYFDEQKPLTGVEFQIYFIADIDINGSLTVKKEFEQFPIDIRGENDTAWRELAPTLESFVLSNQISCSDRNKTDANGCAYFPTVGKHLRSGLYLVLGERIEQNGYRYDALPFFVLLPSPNVHENTWDYQVTVNAKHTSEELSKIPDTINRRVQKVWNDSGRENYRPREIIVLLFQDGKLYDSVTLNAKNNWRHLWIGLDNNSRWTVAEKNVENYYAKVDLEFNTFIVTNTYSGTMPGTPSSSPSKPTLPQTGQLWWPVPILFVLGLVFVVVGVIKQRGNKNDK